MRRVAAFFRREAVLSISLVAALLSFLIAPPGRHTLEGMDTSTLLMLFTLMTVVAGIRAMGLFDRLGAALTRRLHTLRSLCMALTVACFFLSMAATNDVALLTLVPFTLLLMQGAAQRDVILTVVLETVAANLGSMVTPIGNPQNLYLYASGRLTLMDFPRLTWPYAALSLLGLLLLSLRVTSAPVRSFEGEKRVIPRRLAALYGGLGAVALLAVAKVIPPWAAAAAVLAGTLALDRQVLCRVDYALLGTFVCFFVFVSSIRASEPLRLWLEGITARQPLLAPLLASQVISNVPACLLLASFTQDAEALMLGVNLGGLGTLVASLASLISFKLYGASQGAAKGRYLSVFTLLNVGMLGLLVLLAWTLGAI